MHKVCITLIHQKTSIANWNWNNCSSSYAWERSFHSRNFLTWIFWFEYYQRKTVLVFSNFRHPLYSEAFSFHSLFLIALLGNFKFLPQKGLFRVNISIYRSLEWLKLFLFQFAILIHSHNVVYIDNSYDTNTDFCFLYESRLVEARVN